MSEVIIVPTAEITHPIKGHKRLCNLLMELEKKEGSTIPQVIIMSIDQLNKINRQMQAADYYMQNAKKYTLDLETAWSGTNKNELSKALFILKDFVCEAKEPGDEDVSPS